MRCEWGWRAYNLPCWQEWQGSNPPPGFWNASEAEAPTGFAKSEVSVVRDNAKQLKFKPESTGFEDSFSLTVSITSIAPTRSNGAARVGGGMYPTNAAISRVLILRPSEL